MMKNVVVFSVGFWSDVLGSVHMWPSPILWHQCNVSDEDTEEWRETGQTQQLCLLSGNVSELRRHFTMQTKIIMGHNCMY